MPAAWLLLAAALTGAPPAAAVPPPGVSPARVAPIERPPARLETVIPQLGEHARLRLQPAPPPVAGSASESEAVRRYVRGRLRTQAGDGARSADDFDAALRLDPGSPALRAARAEAAAQAGDLERAATEWEAALALAPEDPQALIAVGVAAGAADQHARAAALLGRAWLQLRADGFAALSDAGRATVGGTLARALFRLGFDEAGLEAARVALDASIERTAAQRGDGVDAASRAAAQLAREAGEAALRTGAPAEAAALLERSVALVPDARAAALAAFAQLRAQRTDEARAALAQQLLAEPWNEEEATVLAVWLLESLGGDEAAQSILNDVQEAVLEGDASPTALGRVARLRAAAEPARAAELLAAAVRAGSDDPATLEAALRASTGDAAAALAAETLARAPGALRDIARAWARAAPDAAAVRRGLEALPETAQREALAAAMLAQLRAPGVGWARAQAAADRWPTRRECFESMLAVAAAAADPALVERASALVDAGTDADPSWHASLARAFAETGAPRAAQAELARAQSLGGARGGESARTARSMAHAQAAIDGRAPAGTPRARAEEAVARGDLRAAVAELLLGRWTDPDDAAALGLLVRLLPGSDGARATWDWLCAEVDRSPMDALRWEALVLHAVATRRAPEALGHADARLAADPDDTVALAAREPLLRAIGRAPDALLAARARTQALPPGPRRALEQAALEAQWGDADRAIDALRAFAESASPPPASQRAVALDLCTRLPAATADRATIMRRIARDAILADADASLEFFAFEALGAASDAALDPQERAAAAGMIGTEAAARAALRADAERWRSAGDFLLAQGFPREAGEFLRARIEDPAGLSEQELSMLVRAACACDAAAGGRAGDSMALVARLRAAGLRPLGSSEAPAADFDALSGIYSVVGDRAGAEQILEAGVAVDPEDASILNNLGYARLERGLVDAQTQTLLERADAVRPGEPTILDSLGWMRYLQGQIEDADGRPGARTLLRRAVEAAGRAASAVQWDHYGDALMRAGDRAGAERAWREALRLAEGGMPREEHVSLLRQVFRRQLGVAAIDAGKYHDAHEGAISQRARAKLDALANGTPPAVAPIPAPAAPTP
ncbi:MAG: hypothetical protein U0625_05715 [Phycisphaerales bacterium]